MGAGEEAGSTDDGDGVSAVAAEMGRVAMPYVKNAAGGRRHTTHIFATGVFGQQLSRCDASSNEVLREVSMPTGLFRLLLVTCALSWFLVGMHSPVIHDMIDHGEAPHWPVITFLVTFAITGAASLGMLLRLRGVDSTQAASGSHAT